MGKKTRLLARASTLAIVAATAFAGAHQARADCGESTFDVPANGTIINGPWTCVVMSAPVEGNVTNNGSVGDPGTGFVPFDASQNISGQLINNGSIFGGYANVDGERGALTITSAVGTLVNNGSIISTSGNAVQIGTGGENGGSIENGILNTNTIASGGRYGIAAIEGTLAGGLINQADDQSATISGGLAGIFIGDLFTSWSGGIDNYGQISGIQAAIQMGDGGDEGNILFSGGITNRFGGTIDSSEGPAIYITNDVTTFSGGISNFDDIEGGLDAILIEADNFTGNLYNDTFAQIIGNGESHAGVEANTNWIGDVDNRGLMQGGSYGFQFGGPSYTGNFSNSGTMTGGFAGAWFSSESLSIDGGESPAQFTNTNLIEGGEYGFVIIASGAEDVVNVNFSNISAGGLNPPTPTIQTTGEFGIAGVVLAATEWNGDVNNGGVITGGQYGMLLGAAPGDGLNLITESWDGNVTSTGSIAGGEYGLAIYAHTFNGDVNNGGQISTAALGGNVGLLIQGFCDDTGCEPTTFNGDVTNSGGIFGTNTGLEFEYEVIVSNFHNTSTGSITSGVFGTGVRIVSNSYTGNITNDGVIEGGGDDTGLQIVTNGDHTGNIVNNNLLSAGNRALDIQIDNLVVGVDPPSGLILNTGTIQVTEGSTAVNLLIGNGATFTNAGLIQGDIFFGGKASYDFIAGNGGVQGDLVGETNLSGFNDDDIVVQGAHYFEAGASGGTASNFANFIVQNGGTAIMGAQFVGDTDGAGYAFLNVDTVTVENGGVLYIDKSTTLAIGSDTYTQEAGGTLMFYLGAPSGESESFSDLTGVVVAGDGDYGQLLVSGTANLDGTIAAFLDPAFGSANPGLTEVQYNDVIIAQGGIVGDFDFTALISNNSLFELASIIDGNTVDLHVLRAPVGQVATVGSIVNTGDPFDANITERTSGIGGGCLAAGAGWCRNRYAQGATQVMTDASPGEDPFAWLRAGARRVGETAVWGRGVASWGETDGQALIPGSEYSLGGAIAGVDHVFTPMLLGGAAVQWTTTDVEFGAASGDAEVDSIEVGLYGSIGDARLYANANVSYIWHDFEVNRIVGPNRATGDYDGSTISAYLEAGKTFETDGGLRIQPLLALSYAHLETDAYSETGTGTLLNVLEADVDSLKSIVGARTAYPFELDSGRRLITEVRVAWTHEFMDDHSAHFSDVQGGPFNPVLVTGEEFSRDSVVLGAGVTAPLSENTTVFVDYDAGLNADITTHTISAGLRVRW